MLAFPREYNRGDQNMVGRTNYSGGIRSLGGGGTKLPRAAAILGLERGETALILVRMHTHVL